MAIFTGGLESCIGGNSGATINMANLHALSNQQAQYAQNQYAMYLTSTTGTTAFISDWSKYAPEQGTPPKKKHILHQLRDEIDAWHGDILRAA